MIGKMDRRIRIQAKSVSRTKGEKTSDGWSTLETVYGSLEPMTGYERRIAEQNGLIASHKIRIRYRDDLNGGELTPDMQFVIDGVEYEIRSVLNPEFRNKFYDVMAQTRL